MLTVSSLSLPVPCGGLEVIFKEKLAYEMIHFALQTTKLGPQARLSGETTPHSHETALVCAVMIVVCVDTLLLITFRMRHRRGEILLATTMCVCVCLSLAKFHTTVQTRM